MAGRGTGRLLEMIKKKSEQQQQPESSEPPPRPTPPQPSPPQPTAQRVSPAGAPSVVPPPPQTAEATSSPQQVRKSVGRGSMIQSILSRQQPAQPARQETQRVIESGANIIGQTPMPAEAQQANIFHRLSPTAEVARHALPSPPSAPQRSPTQIVMQKSIIEEPRQSVLRSEPEEPHVEPAIARLPLSRGRGILASGRLPERARSAGRRQEEPVEEVRPSTSRQVEVTQVTSKLE